MKNIITSITLLLISANILSQDPGKMISEIFSEALTDRTAYNHLEYLCKKTKGRLAGSAASLRAIDYTRKALTDAGADTVWLQKVTVPHWLRGSEKCMVRSSVCGTMELTISALGLSVGTEREGISAGVIEVQSFDELRRLGKENIEGRIVFFNRPVDNSLINTFSGYGGAVDQRISGASEAAAYGASAVIVRSATQFLDDFPHTGTLRYIEGVKKIPAVAVSIVDADLLGSWLDKDPLLSVNLISTCKNLPDTISYNVIGEIRGSAKPDEYITVGGHLDSWDITEGAHDDAGGCVQAIEMIRIYRKLG
ncbi:MAG: M28 family peptidase, partial [Bacteroidales bacterium]|nr:M28 family peptidase [Bacteroidales bacterium]